MGSQLSRYLQFKGLSNKDSKPDRDDLNYITESIRCSSNDIIIIAIILGMASETDLEGYATPLFPIPITPCLFSRLSTSCYEGGPNF